jgi:hypothetical protein
MFKILKCAGSDDIITISAQDDIDRVTFVFESPSAAFATRLAARRFTWHSCQLYENSCPVKTYVRDNWFSLGKNCSRRSLSGDIILRVLHPAR